MKRRTHGASDVSGMTPSAVKASSRLFSGTTAAQTETASRTGVNNGESCILRDVSLELPTVGSAEMLVTRRETWRSHVHCLIPREAHSTGSSARTLSDAGGRVQSEDKSKIMTQSLGSGSQISGFNRPSAGSEADFRDPGAVVCCLRRLSGDDGCLRACPVGPAGLAA